MPGRILGGRDIIPDMWPASGEKAGVFVNAVAASLPTVRPDGRALQEGDFCYLASDDTLYFHNGSSFIAHSAASGAVSLNGAYASGATISKTSTTPIVITDTGMTTGNTLEINLDAAGSGNGIDIDTGAAFTGDAINITMTGAAVTGQALVITSQAAIRTTSALVAISEAGTGAVPTLGVTGDAATTGPLVSISATAAVAPVAGTNGMVTIALANAADAAEGLFLVNSTTSRTGAILGISDAGTTTGQCVRVVQTGTSSANAIQYTCSGAVTGDAVNITMTNAGAAAQALVIVGASATTSNLVSISSPGTGGGNIVAIAATSTMSGDLLDLSTSGAITGDFLAITFTNANDAADGITMTGRATSSTGTMLKLIDAVTTGSGPSIEIQGTGAKNSPYLFVNVDSTGTGKLIHFDIDGAHTGSKFHIDVDAAATGPLIDVDLDSTGSSVLLDIDIGTGVWTGKMITFDTSQAYNTIFADLTFTNCGASIQALKVTGSATTRTAKLFEIIEAGTPSGATFDISHGGASTSDVIHCDQSNAVASRCLNLDGAGTRTVNLIDIDTTGADTASAVDITTTAVGANNVAGALQCSGSGTLVAGADLCRFVSTGNISSTSNVLAIEQNTGAGSAGAFGLYISCTGTNVEALKVDDGTATFDESVTVSGALTNAAATIHSGIETIAAGGTSTALSLTKTLHSIDADAGGDTFTLADGTIGQVMIITCLSSTGTCTITPTNFNGGTSVTFNAAGDSVQLCFVDTKWYIIGGNSYAVV